MRLVMKVDYSSFLFGQGANVSELIAAFDNVQIVSEQGYGKEKKYIVSREVHPELTLVPDDSISLPENENELIDKYHEVATERDKLRSEIYNLKKQIEDMKKSAESIVKESYGTK